VVKPAKISEIVMRVFPPYYLKIMML